MTILPDGRWRMSSAEMTNKIWEKLKTWTRDPADDRCLIPDFPPCTRRSLEVLCKPCGAQSNLGYHCSKHNMKISVAYCKDCANKGENENGPDQPHTETEARDQQIHQVQLPTDRTDLLGTTPSS